MKALKTATGVVLIIIGFLALITPLTPGAWLLFVGLEFLGIRLAAWDKLKAWLFRKKHVHPPDTEKPDTDTHITR